MHKISWEALIARCVPHPGCGSNSIYTRTKLCEKHFWSFIAWSFSWSLEYCTHSAKLALIDRRIISLSIPLMRLNALWAFVQSVFHLYMYTLQNNFSYIITVHW